MFTKALIISGLAALATAQSTVLGFSHVPNPVVDGTETALTYFTNDTSSVSPSLAKAAPRSIVLTAKSAGHYHPSQGRRHGPPDREHSDNYRDGWPVHLDATCLTRKRQRLRKNRWLEAWLELR